MRDLTQIDGVAVVERTRARMSEKDAPNMGVVGKEIATVDEVLLADGRVVYQCVHPKGPDCVYTALGAKSVTAHQVAHGRNALNRRLRLAETELIDMKSRAAKIRENRSNGAVKAAQTKRAKRLALPAEAGHHTQEPTTDLEAASRRVVTAYNAMQDAADEFQRVFLGYMRLAVTAATPAPVDPAILAKAEKWDKYLEFQQFITSTGELGSTPTSNPRRRTERKS